jgi:hypothetical protein
MLRLRSTRYSTAAFALGNAESLAAQLSELAGTQNFCCSTHKTQRLGFASGLDLLLNDPSLCFDQNGLNQGR